MSVSNAADVLLRKPRNVAISTNPAHELNIIENDHVPQPGPHEVLVHVRATGICGSDVHFWKDGRIGDSVIEHECGLGHESAGVIIQIGDSVTNVKIGKFAPPLGRARHHAGVASVLTCVDGARGSSGP